MMTPRHFPRSLILFLLLLLNAFVLELLLSLLTLLFDLVNDLFPLSVLLLLLSPIEYLVKLFLIHVIATSLLDLSLQLIDLLHILSLFLMLFSLLVSLDGLMELFVLQSLLLLLECLDLILLMQQSAFHLRHVLVALQHLRKEIIRSANGHFGLNQYLHAFLNVLSGDVIATQNN